MSSYLFTDTGSLTTLGQAGLLDTLLPTNNGGRTLVIKDHRLVRCYANAFSFGRGSLHADSHAFDGNTAVYCASERWQPDSGRDTVFFNTQKNNIVSTIFPRRRDHHWRRPASDRICAVAAFVAIGTKAGGER
jgi:hypothetical protein